MDESVQQLAGKIEEVLAMFGVSDDVIKQASFSVAIMVANKANEMSDLVVNPIYRQEDVIIAYSTLRKHNHTIPDEILDEMRDILLTVCKSHFWPR